MDYRSKYERENNKTLEENIEDYFYGLGVGKDYLNSHKKH